MPSTRGNGAVVDHTAQPKAPGDAVQSLSATLEVQRRAPPSSFHTLRTQLGQLLHSLTQELCDRYHRQGGSLVADEQETTSLVEQMIDTVGRAPENEAQWRQEARKAATERALEDAVFTWLSADESQDEGMYFAVLYALFDVLLKFVEQGYADDTLPLTVMNNVLELQTVTGCQKIFEYVESRRKRLTKGMLPTRGKGPLLLRLSNELLRRLPKTKQEHVVFSGRVLMFLNSVFPLGEKSGVNLRGNFNVGKVTTFQEQPSAEPAVIEIDVEAGEEKPVSQEEEAATFYTTFWSLQRIFTDPPSLFAPTSTSSVPDPWAELKSGLSKTLSAFASVTKRERELSGSTKEGTASNGKQRETHADLSDDAIEDYFFPKFLTSQKLLDLELADPSFRRQILVQMLVLFQYLLSFALTERARLAKITSNLAALPNYTLSADKEKWLKDLRNKTLAEMDNMESGRRFRHTIELILRREKNWTDWKLRGCYPIEKPAISADKSDVARTKLKAIARKQKAYPYQLGNPNLARAWQRNTTTLDGFEPMEIVDDFDRLARDFKMANKMLAMRRGQLDQAKAAQAANRVAELSAEIETLAIKVDALHWRAIRSASATYLHLFPKIGSGDLDLLLKEIETERQAKLDKEAALNDSPSAVGDATGVTVDGVDATKSAGVEIQEDVVVAGTEPEEQTGQVETESIQGPGEIVGEVTVGSASEPQFETVQKQEQGESAGEDVATISTGEIATQEDVEMVAKNQADVVNEQPIETPSATDAVKTEELAPLGSPTPSKRPRSQSADDPMETEGESKTKKVKTDEIGEPGHSDPSFAL